MIKKALMGGAAAAALTLSLTGTSFAGYDVNSRIDTLENELRELKAQMQMRDSKLAELEEASTGLADMPVFDSHKLMVSSRDGQWSIRFGGRLMLDAFLSDESRTGGTGLGGGNGAEIRRARFFASGKVAGDWKYKLQLDFAENKVTIKDAYIATSFAGLTAKFGNHHEPMGMNEITSSKYITFMERAQSNDIFAPGRNLGASVATGGANWGARAGLFTNGIDNGGQGATTDWALTGRVHYAPLAEKTRVVHLGLSGSYRGFDDNSGPTITSRGYHNGTKFINAATNAEAQTTIGTEAAVVFGPFSAQGEYYWSTLEGNGTGASNIDLDGGYAFVSYFLTGESRAYNAKSGVFGRVKGEGAIELAARYDVVNLDDTGFTTNAAETTSWTLGANYYFNPYVRMMLNYQNTAYDFTVASGTADADVDFYGTRLQLDF